MSAARHDGDKSSGGLAERVKGSAGSGYNGPVDLYGRDVFFGRKMRRDRVMKSDQAGDGKGREAGEHIRPPVSYQTAQQLRRHRPVSPVTVVFEGLQPRGAAAKPRLGTVRLA